MAFTAFKKLSAQAAASASGTWGAGGTTGVDLNTGVMGTLDTILGGTSSFSVASSNVSLTFAAGGGGDVSNVYWKFTGVLTSSIVVSPTAGDATTYLNGFYLFSNTTSGSFTITVTTADGSVVLPQGRRGVLYVSTVNNVAPVIVAIAGSGTADPVPAGSQTIWFNTSAPSGWTAVALNDYAVKIVSNGAGGVGSGTLAYSTVFGQTVTGSHTLTVAEMPSHDHALGASAYVGSGTGLASFSAGANIPTTPVASAGVSLTGGGSGHTHIFDTRVLTAAFVLASRN